MQNEKSASALNHFLDLFVTTAIPLAKKRENEAPKPEVLAFHMNDMDERSSIYQTKTGSVSLSDE
jgi:hypothetical protein